MTSPNTICAIILAAGSSRRMVLGNKLLLPLNGIPMIEMTTNTVAAIKWHQILIVTGHQAEKVRTVLTNPDLTFTTNPNYAQGMGGSVAVGAQAASDLATGFIIIQGDMPLLKKETLRALRQCLIQGRPQTIAVPTMNGKRGNPVGFGSHWRDYLQALNGEVGARGLLAHKDAELVKVPVDDPGIFTDIDTPARYAQIVEGGI